MGFLLPKPQASAPPPPPPNPPTLASGAVQQSADQAQRAAAAAAGQGFGDTLKTGPSGAPDPTTATKSLLGS